MLASTTNMGLKRWEDTDNFVVADVNSNFEAIDDLAGIKSYTTATRPTTNRFEGRKIFNSTLNVVEEWIAGRWRVTTPSSYRFDAASSGWQAALHVARIQGITDDASIASFQAVLERTGANFAVSAAAWSDTGLAVAAAKLRPTTLLASLFAVLPAMCISNTTVAQNSGLAAYIQPADGSIVLRSQMGATFTINTGTKVYINGQYTVEAG